VTAVLEALEPQSAEMHADLGLIFFERHQFDDAKRHYEQPLKINANFAPARVNLAALYFSVGNDKQAIEQSELALRVIPDLPAAQICIAMALCKQGARRRSDQPVAARAGVDTRRPARACGACPNTRVETARLEEVRRRLAKPPNEKRKRRNGGPPTWCNRPAIAKRFCSCHACCMHRRVQSSFGKRPPRCNHWAFSHRGDRRKINQIPSERVFGNSELKKTSNDAVSTNKDLRRKHPTSGNRRKCLWLYCLSIIRAKLGVSLLPANFHSRYAPSEDLSRYYYDIGETTYIARPL
jgi:tetratricopeptide (TPR) repeat protein